MAKMKMTEREKMIYRNARKTGYKQGYKNGSEDALEDYFVTGYNVAITTRAKKELDFPDKKSYHKKSLKRGEYK